MKKIIVASVALALAGCATTSEITPAGSGSYIIASDAGMGGGSTLKVELIKRAGEFCTRQGKDLTLLHEQQSDSKWGSMLGGEGGSVASAELQFRCGS